MYPDEPNTAESPQPDAVESGQSSPATASPSKTGAAGSLARSWWQRLGPVWRQTWRNLRVWLPGLSNPDFREREVVYGAREAREVAEWQIALPERCWECDATDGLSHREHFATVRSFEYALHIFCSGMGSTFVLALIALWISSWFTLFLALGAFVVTVGLLWLKSWQESIRVAIYSCEEHKTEEPGIEMVVDDAELHLYLPNRRIAEHARALLKKNRRSRGAYDTDAGYGAPSAARPISVDDKPAGLPTATDVPGTGRYVSPHGSQRPSVPDLPPISLDEGPLLADEDEDENKEENREGAGPADGAQSAKPSGE